MFKNKMDWVISLQAPEKEKDQRLSKTHIFNMEVSRVGVSAPKWWARESVMI